MKKTIIIIFILFCFYFNVFVIKSMGANVLIVISFLFHPVFCFWMYKKENNEGIKRKDAILSIIIWCLAVIPTGGLIAMTIIFGFPPEGYKLFGDLI
ncbi:MAG: hypothetical protein C4522_17935 [Desulfobacteraceae bacterium]|nr:MAG: hypothetical protein C4522_17935 [Desulfobacteraceae bacterium]